MTVVKLVNYLPEESLSVSSLQYLGPRLSTADLFDILLPMLNIYQEFVRNHQYSLQILAHCKQNRDFDKLLKQYEAKPDCEERTLETFLTYPMFQVGSLFSPINTTHKDRAVRLLQSFSPEPELVVNCERLWAKFLLL